MKGNKAIKHKLKGNFPFSNPISCNNTVKSAQSLVQSDEESQRSLWKFKSSRMACSCGSSQNPACTLALGQWNNFKEIQGILVSENLLQSCVVSLAYLQAGQLLVPIQNGLLIWAFICKESSVQRQRNCLLRGLTVEQHISDLESEQQCSHLLWMTLKCSVFQSHLDISGAQFSLTLMQKEQLDLPRIT